MTTVASWQPIETAPKDREVLFWVVPLSAEETYRDTSGNPITSGEKPRMMFCRFGRWSSLSKAIYWADVPGSPTVTKESGYTWTPDAQGAVNGPPRESDCATDEPKAGAQSMSEQPTSNQHLSWADMFAQVCQHHSGKRIAEVIGVSEQYVSDLRRGMRRPTVEITDKICDWMGRGPKGRLEWHQAGARAHGWQV